MLTDLVRNEAFTNLILAGPCGIGKTTFAQQLTLKIPTFKHIELDEVKQRIKGNPSPCSLRYFDLEKCLSPEITNCEGGFVIDLGGDAVFRPHIDNLQRVKQILDFKVTHTVTVALLLASRELVEKRFLSSKHRHFDEFESTWQIWESIEYPHWLKCVDLLIDVEQNTIKRL